MSERVTDKVAEARCLQRPFMLHLPLRSDRLVAAIGERGVGRVRVVALTRRARLVDVCSRMSSVDGLPRFWRRACSQAPSRLNEPRIRGQRSVSLASRRALASANSGSAQRQADARIPIGRPGTDRAALTSTALTAAAILPRNGREGTEDGILRAHDRV